LQFVAAPAGAAHAIHLPFIVSDLREVERNRHEVRRASPTRQLR
jgi:hypothetical protein